MPRRREEGGKNESVGGRQRVAGSSEKSGWVDAGSMVIIYKIRSPKGLAQETISEESKSCKEWEVVNGSANKITLK